MFDLVFNAIQLQLFLINKAHRLAFHPREVLTYRLWVLQMTVWNLNQLLPIDVVALFIQYLHDEHRHQLDGHAIEVAQVGSIDLLLLGEVFYYLHYLLEDIEASVDLILACDIYLIKILAAMWLWHQINCDVLQSVGALQAKDREIGLLWESVLGVAQGFGFRTLGAEDEVYIDGVDPKLDQRNSCLLNLPDKFDLQIILIFRAFATVRQEVIKLIEKSRLLTIMLQKAHFLALFLIIIHFQRFILAEISIVLGTSIGTEHHIQVTERVVGLQRVRAERNEFERLRLELLLALLHVWLVVFFIIISDPLLQKFKYFQDLFSVCALALIQILQKIANTRSRSFRLLFRSFWVSPVFDWKVAISHVSQVFLDQIVVGLETTAKILFIGPTFICHVHVIKLLGILTVTIWRLRTSCSLKARWWILFRVLIWWYVSEWIPDHGFLRMEVLFLISLWHMIITISRSIISHFLLAFLPVFWVSILLILIALRHPLSQRRLPRERGMSITFSICVLLLLLVRLLRPKDLIFGCHLRHVFWVEIVVLSVVVRWLWFPYAFAFVSVVFVAPLLLLSIVFVAGRDVFWFDVIVSFHL